MDHGPGWDSSAPIVPRRVAWSWKLCRVSLIHVTFRAASTMSVQYGDLFVDFSFAVHPTVYNNAKTFRNNILWTSRVDQRKKDRKENIYCGPKFPGAKSEKQYTTGMRKLEMNTEMSWRLLGLSKRPPLIFWRPPVGQKVTILLWLTLVYLFIYFLF